MVKYRLPRKRTWIELSPYCVAVVPQQAGDETLPRLGCPTRRQFWEEYTKTPARAAFETTVDGLRDWLARGRCVRKGTDRQRILGGIFDRGILIQGIRQLGISKLDRCSKVRIEAVQSRSHYRGQHILVVRIGKGIVCLMCCVEGTETGCDPLPLGRAA